MEEELTVVLDPEQRPLRVFVYGTLMSGEPNHPVMVRAKGKLIGRGQVAGRLYHLGGFPGLRLDRPATTVYGEVFEIPDVDSYRVLDQLEGVRGMDGLYLPCVTEVTRVTDDGQVVGDVCAVYHINHEPSDASYMPNGRWAR